jgi:hypothetical protein
VQSEGVGAPGFAAASTMWMLLVPVPDYEVIHWYGMWGPKGLQREIATRWNQEVSRDRRRGRIAHRIMVGNAHPTSHCHAQEPGKQAKIVIAP